jgi:sugar-specific transcriptional regulator TrmB
MVMFVEHLQTNANNLNRKRQFYFRENSKEENFLESQFSKHKILVDLGLTLTQARVYLALVESGPLTVAEISRAANVARPDVYPILSKLYHLCLVEKIIKKPLTFKAIPIDKGLSRLLETKTSQYEKVRAETRLLLELAKKEHKENKENIEAPQLVLIPEGKAVLEEINTAIEKAQQNINLLLSWKRFSRGITNTFAESIEKAWTKKVKTRLILEQPSPSKTAKQLIRSYKEKPFCQIKFIPYLPDTIFGTFDKKETLIILFSKKDSPNSPALYATHHSLIALADDYFEMLWSTSTDNVKNDLKNRKIT